MAEGYREGERGSIENNVSARIFARSNPRQINQPRKTSLPSSRGRWLQPVPFPVPRDKGYTPMLLWTRGLKKRKNYIRSCCSILRKTISLCSLFRRLGDECTTCDQQVRAIVKFLIIERLDSKICICCDIGAVIPDICVQLYNTKSRTRQIEPDTFN